ncbi:hypothetical protein QQ045_009243 [Rhodiola kirilowii]
MNFSHEKPPGLTGCSPGKTQAQFFIYFLQSTSSSSVICLLPTPTSEESSASGRGTIRGATTLNRQAKLAKG